MRKYLGLSVLLGIMLVILSSCNEIVGNGEVVTNEINVSGFKKLNISLPAEIKYAVGDAYSVTIKGESNIISDIEYSVSNDQLVLDFRDKINFRYEPTEPIVIHITSPQLDEIRIGSAANFTALTEIKNGTFTCRLSGASNASFSNLLVDKINFDLSGSSTTDVQSINANKASIETSGSSEVSVEEIVVQELHTSSSGSSEIKLQTGSANDQKVSLSGSSSFSSKELVAQKVSVSASGASEAAVHCEQSLKVDASGASQITYAGNPSTQFHTSGASEVQKTNDAPSEKLPSNDNLENRELDSVAEGSY